ncbi:RNA polymerase sigma factor [Hyphococcus sp. DH-69]|uniref:RNA polymerase sigma factor n=1 Tax=Hyphococcus formosus TaxID=3143534 RepID=UPI00398BB58A
MSLEQSRSQLSAPSISPKVGVVIAMPNRSDTDEVLIEKVRNHRDRDALNSLASHYGPRLKSWLVCRGEDSHAAEDIVQDVMVTVWVKANKYDPSRGKFSTWLFRLTRNRWIDCKRKSQRVDVTAPDDLVALVDGAVDGADAAFDQNEISAAIHKQLALLPAEQKHVLYLSFFEGLSHGEIAKRTGLALGTVKSRIRAPLKKMQESMTEFSEYFND